jgi:uncharacterized damage-inducible protein DinB
MVKAVIVGQSMETIHKVVNHISAAIHIFKKQFTQYGT